MKRTLNRIRACQETISRKSGILTLAAIMTSFHEASAKSGAVNYSWGADALANAHDFTVTMMLYVLYLTFAVAAIMVVISSLQIYFKMQNGEGEITKSLMTLIGAIFFMIGASVVFPAFFGYRI